MADIIIRLLFFPMEVPTSQQPVFGQMPNILDFNAQIHNIYILSATCLCQKWHAFKTFLRTVVIQLLMTAI